MIHRCKVDISAAFGGVALAVLLATGASKMGDLGQNIAGSLQNLDTTPLHSSHSHGLPTAAAEHIAFEAVEAVAEGAEAIAVTGAGFFAGVALLGIAGVAHKFVSCDF